MRSKTKYMAVLLCSIFAIVSVLLLFQWSEKIMHADNPFIRRYVLGCMKMHQIDLTYNSYYFAGFSKDKVFLGNSVGPLHVTMVDSALFKKSSFKLEPDRMDLPFTSPVLSIIPPHTYLIDGGIPAVFKGRLGSPKIKLCWKGTQRFSQPHVLNQNTLVCRTIDPESSNSELALVHFGARPRFEIHRDLLQKQVDGLFDSDGSLHFSSKSASVIYTYLYRNEFIIADTAMKLRYRGRTIDTTTRAKIEVAHLPDRGEMKLSRPPRIVNRMSAVDRNLLFVGSSHIGKFEDPMLWKQASIIDVYDIAKNNYVASFYIYNIDGKRARAIGVDNGRLYALIGTQLVYYRLDELIRNQYESR